MFRVTSGGLLLGSGQALGRLASLVLVAYLARRLSIREFGELVLAQTLGRYVVIGTDMGSRFIGARLIAKEPEATPQVLANLQRKRIILGIVSTSLVILYAIEGPVLPFARGFLVLFLLSAFLYALNIDWVAWGMKRFLLMGGSQAGSAFLSLAVTILFLELFNEHPLDWVVAGNAVSLVGGAAVVWVWWITAGSKRGFDCPNRETGNILRRETRWGPVLLLGIAAAFNVAFQCSDVLLLGGLSTAEQVAQYGAAYKVINVILNSFWLFTTAAYPFLAGVQWSRRTLRLLALALTGVGMGGLAVAAGIHQFVQPLTLLLFGPKFGAAAELLGVLALAIPFDFVASSCATVLVASGKNLPVTLGISIGLAVNLAMNFAWIPAHGALGAARATVGSYIVLVCTLGVPLLWLTSSRFAGTVGLVPAPPEGVD